MTLYSYRCQTHGAMDIRHPMSDVGKPQFCPQCNTLLRRVFVPIHHRWPSNHRPGFEESGNRLFLDPEFQARQRDVLAKEKEEHLNRTAKEAARDTGSK